MLFLRSRICFEAVRLRIALHVCLTAVDVLQIPSYIQIVGIILGMITIGYLGDRIGRKWGSVTTVSIMFVRFLRPLGVPWL